MLRIMESTKKSKREVDVNSFVLYPENPITKEGVFEYLGESLDRDGDLGLIPSKMYNVYRPASSLKDPDFLKSLELCPIFIDHHFVSGDQKEGFESPDDVVPRGALGQNIYFDDASGELRADTKVFSPLLQKTIDAGKKEISLAYFARYLPQKGEFKGVPYDFVQTDMIANHASCVLEGRCGPSVSFADSSEAPKKTQDVLKIKIGDSKQMNKQEKVVTKDEDDDNYTPVDVSSDAPDDEAGAENVAEKAKEILQKAAMITEDPVTGLSPAEVEAVLDPNEAEEIEAVTEDEDDDQEDKDKTEDEDDDEGEGDEGDDKEKDKVEDQKIRRMAESITARVVKDIAQKNALISKLGQHINMKSYNADSKTFKDVQLYGIKKLGLNCAKGSEAMVLDAYFQGRKTVMDNLAKFAKKSTFADSKETRTKKQYTENFYNTLLGD